MIEKEVAIAIATHKPYSFPSDDGYLPLQVGKTLSQMNLRMMSDDTGDNISVLNPYFCELTGLYWLWKNMQSDYYGLVHYRRYFTLGKGQLPLVSNQKVAKSSDLVAQLEHYDIILAKPRNYWIESVGTHYANAHYVADLEKVEQILKASYPDYLKAYNEVLSGTSLSLYNMFVMRSEHFQNYCEWLFDILFQSQALIPYQTYGEYQQRVFGFLGERLLNVWVKKNIPIDKVCYLPVVHIEGEKFLQKLNGFLSRKLFGSKKS